MTATRPDGHFRPDAGKAPTVTIRPMRWWDIDAVMPVEEELFGNESWSAPMFWSELAEHRSRWYVAVDGPAADRIGAYAGLCAFGTDEAYVQTIAVAPELQGRGVGTALLEALIGEARCRGCHRLDLEVRADNDGAQRLYARHGFAPIGRRRAYYQPSGTDAVVMRLDLRGDGS